ncbi:helix-turn-helix domain-containing protein [Butyricimonas sp.]|uniref:helix-turn-helix domain-containing protein n=1 Tax=Butyricimonas sp. TaxID=1969738 RepID=UPI0025BE99C8|nr:helix-turn-helix domain-containing protein [Butyricimonas sp.]
MKLEVNKLEKKLKATEVEIYIINKVMEYRVAANYSKARLSLELRLSKSYVGRIENSNCKEKYNVNILNEAAKILGCRMADFMPDPFVQSDSIEEYMNLHPEIKAKYDKLEQKRDEKTREKIEEQARKKKEAERKRKEKVEKKKK